MQITSEQASMLIDLVDAIKIELGYSIGYTHPCGSFTSLMNDFVLFDTLTEPELVAREDMERREAGIFVEESPNDFLLHDDRVEDFLKEINEAIANGLIFFDPEVKKVIDNKTYEIKRKADGRFSVWVIDAHTETGFTRSIRELQKEDDFEGHHKKILEIIRDEWSEVLNG